MEETRYQDIFMCLKEHGIDVYTPTQKKTECVKPYVVIRTGQTNQYNNLSSTRTVYDILCYVPKNQYTLLESYALEVKGIMAKLKPMIMPMYTETAPFYDDTVKAHMVSISYRNMRYIG